MNRKAWNIKTAINRPIFKVCCLMAVLCLYALLPGLFNSAQASTGGHSQAEAVQWIINQEGHATDTDPQNGNGIQCVDLITLYYQYLGHSIPSIGYARNLDNSVLPDGWTLLDGSEMPRAGDIFINEANEHGAYYTGHVGLIMQVNENGLYYLDYNHTNRHEVGTKYYTASIHDFSHFLRPDFDTTPPTISNIHKNYNNPGIGFQLTCNVEDDTAVSQVCAVIFPKEAPDRMKVFEGIFKDGVATFEIDVQKTGYNDPEGIYGFYLYACDPAGNKRLTKADYATIYYPCLANPGIYRIGREDAVVRIAPRETFNGNSTYAYTPYKNGINQLTVLGSLKVNGVEWYRLGNCQWILASDVVFHEKESSLELLWYDYLGHYCLIEDDEVVSSSIAPILDETLELATYIEMPELPKIQLPSITAEGKCGNNLSWTLDEYSNLRITGEGAMYNYNKDSAPWGVDVREVYINSGVNSIGIYAFSSCSYLTKISIPDSVTKIGAAAFWGCENLISISLPDSVISIGEQAFFKCSSLTNITIPYGVTSINDNTFMLCSSLKDIVIPDSVTDIGAAAFQGCDNLTSFIIPNGVKYINRLTFLDCESLKSISIPSSVISIDVDAFGGCRSLTNITIPNSVTSIGEYAFDCCTSLTAILIPDSVTSIGDNAFSECDHLEDVKISNNITSLGNYIFSNCFCLKNIIIPETVTSIGHGAFYRCYDLMSISIPRGVTSIDDIAFLECNSLTDVWYGGSKSTWSEISIGEQNDALFAATIHYAEGANAEFIVSYDLNIIDSNISSWYTAPVSQTVTTGLITLENIIKQTPLTYRYGISDGCGYDFAGWATSPTAKIAVYQPGDTYAESSGITFYAVWSKKTMQVAFNDADVESPISIEFGTAYTLPIPTRNGYQFAGWMYYPRGWVGGIGLTAKETMVINDNYSFTAKWDKVNQLILPSALTAIEEEAVMGTAPYHVTIPAGVTSIGDRAFANNQNLYTVTVNAKSLMIGQNVFANCPNVTVYCYAGTDIQSYCKALNIPYQLLDSGWVFEDFTLVETASSAGTTSTDEE